MKCHHCQRRLEPTRHGRSGITVDYYRTVTGPLQSQGPANQGEREVGEEAPRNRQVVSLSEFCTCRDCWQRREIQAWLSAAWRSGVIDS